MFVGDMLVCVCEYEVFFECNGVGNIILSFELFRIVCDW